MLGVISVDSGSSSTDVFSDGHQKLPVYHSLPTSPRAAVAVITSVTVEVTRQYNISESIQTCADSHWCNSRRINVQYTYLVNW